MDRKLKFGVEGFGPNMKVCPCIPPSTTIDAKTMCMTPMKLSPVTSQALGT